MKYLANSKNKQPLDLHLKGVAKRAVEVLTEANFHKYIHSLLVEPLEQAALLHDIGKISDEFQSLIIKTIDQDNEMERGESKKGKKKWSEIYHHEISWAIYRTFVTPSYNQLTNDIIEHAIYWHHPKPRRKEELYVEDFLKQIDKEKVNEFLIHIGLTPFGLSNVSGVLPPNMYFNKSNEITHQAYKNIALNCLIEADRGISQLSVSDLNKYLETGECDLFIKEKEERRIREIIDNSERTQCQIDLAQKMAQCPVSVLGADPGAGKTSVSLLWKYFLNNGKKLIIALPKRAQVDGLINVISEDYSRMFSDKTTFQSFHSGGIQFNSDQQLENIGADVNVLIIDRLISSSYRRDCFNEYLTIIKSDLIFDEFHELLGLPNMLPILKTLLLIRSWVKEESQPKTLFLSGTPDHTISNYLLKEIGFESFSRSELPEVHKNTKTFEYKTERTWGLETLYSLNTVENAQRWYLQNESEVLLVHSQFKDEDRERSIKKLFELTGKKSSGNSWNVVTARLLESSFDISLKNAQLTISHPNTIAQFLGRVDRFGNLPNGTVFLIQEENQRVWKGFEKIGNSFDQYLYNLLSTAKKWTHREAVVNIWDEFWTKENIKIQAKYLDDKLVKSFKTLKEGADPYKKNKWTGKDKVVTQGNLLRGENRVATAEIMDRNGATGKWLGPEELVNFAKEFGVGGWNDVKMDTKKTTVVQREELNKLGFDYPTQRHHWSKTEHVGQDTSVPFILNEYLYSSEIGLVKKSALS